MPCDEDDGMVEPLELRVPIQAAGGIRWRSISALDEAGVLGYGDRESCELGCRQVYPVLGLLARGPLLCSRDIVPLGIAAQNKVARRDGNDGREDILHLAVMIGCEAKSGETRRENRDAGGRWGRHGS